MLYVRASAKDRDTGRGATLAMPWHTLTQYEVEDKDNDNRGDENAHAQSLFCLSTVLASTLHRIRL
jgi:hypothetical protein